MCKCRECKGQACICQNCNASDECKYYYTDDCRWIEIGGKVDGRSHHKPDQRTGRTPIIQDTRRICL